MSTIINHNILSKGWKRFDIMHLDRRVASVYEDGRCGIFYPSFLPYNLYLEKGEDIDTRLNNLNNFYYWCASRVLTLDRAYAKEIMNSIGAKQSGTDKDRAAIALSYHALTLTDVFWTRAINEKLSFCDISLYRHSLSNAFADVSLCGRQLTAQNAELLAPQDAAGDIGTSGVAPKAWVRKDGAFYLLKDGNFRDVNAELLASKIVGCFNVSHIAYSQAIFENTAVSECRSITSEEKSIVPFSYIEIYCANHNRSAFGTVLEKDSYGYYMMNIVDYLIGNTDRHWGNWGFFVDNKTNKLICLHPLMDFNKAFLSYDSIEGAICQTTERKISQKEAALEAVNKVGLNQIKDIDKEWFTDESIKEMFFKRLSVLKVK